MNAEHILQKARDMFVKDYERELGNGILSPSENKSPIWPPWSAIEYESMERDTSKYFLYYSAINMALQDLVKSSKSKDDSVIVCLVLGAGRGRLVDYCLDCLSENEINGVVHVIEAGSEALKIIEEKYDGDDRVIVHSPITIRDYDEIMAQFQKSQFENNKLKKLAENKNVSLIVSELFGSFGDNEFMTEILSAALKLFGSDSQCVSIPESYTNFICPVYSESLQKYFDKMEDDGGSDKLEALYILGLPKDAVLIAEMEELYSSKSTVSHECLQGRVKFNFSSQTKVAKTDSDGSVKEDVDEPSLQHGETKITGIAGHFTAILYGDIIIDTRPSPTRNTYFWETAFFPLNGKTREKIHTLLNAHRSTGEQKYPFRRRSLSSSGSLHFKLTRNVSKVEEFDFAGELPKNTKPGRRNPLFSLWYEWSVVDDDDTVVGTVQNDGGRFHSLHL